MALMVIVGTVTGEKVTGEKVIGDKVTGGRMIDERAIGVKATVGAKGSRLWCNLIAPDGSMSDLMRCSRLPTVTASRS